MSQVVRKVLKRYKCRQFLLWVWSQNKAFEQGSHQLETCSMKVKTTFIQTTVLSSSTHPRLVKCIESTQNAMANFPSFSILF